MSMSHDEMIAVIQHHRDGGRIQIANQGKGNFEYTSKPIWDFNIFDYRAEPEPRSLFVAFNSLGNLIIAMPDRAIAEEMSGGREVYEYKEVLHD